MKAAVYTKYGPPEVIHLHETETPVPKEKEVQVKVAASTVKFGDSYARHFNDVSPFQFTMPLPLWIPARLVMGWSKPKQPVLGSEFSGVITAVGDKVTRFRPGETVFGYTGQKFGAYAEYLCINAEGIIARKPENLTPGEAAALPYGALMALNLLRKANLKEKEKLLIIGASGGIGSAAVQLAKNYFGAEVTGVCSSAGTDYVKSLGADNVIDYTKEDFTNGGASYDVILDIPRKASFSKCRPILRPGGRYMPVSFKGRHVLQRLLTLPRRKKVITALALEKADDLLLIQELAEIRKIKPVIARSFPLEQTAEAHRWFDQKGSRGSVGITINAELS